MPEGCPYYDLFLVESAYYFFVKICKAACDSLFHIYSLCLNIYLASCLNRFLIVKPSPDIVKFH